MVVSEEDFLARGLIKYNNFLTGSINSIWPIDDTLICAFILGPNGLADNGFQRMILLFPDFQKRNHTIKYISVSYTRQPSPI